MKLVFRKNEAGEISVFRKEASAEKPFVYRIIVRYYLLNELFDLDESLDKFMEALVVQCCGFSIDLSFKNVGVKINPVVYFTYR